MSLLTKYTNPLDRMEKHPIHRINVGHVNTSITEFRSRSAFKMHMDFFNTRSY